MALMAASIADPGTARPEPKDAVAVSGEERFLWNPEAVIQDEHATASSGTEIDPETGSPGGPGSLVGKSTTKPDRRTAACELVRIMGFARSGCEFEINRGRSFAVLPPPDRMIGDSSEYFRCATSGTTGPAKTIRRSHRSWISSFRINQHLWSINSSDAYGVLGDLSNSLPLYASLEALHLGADLHLLSGYLPSHQARELISRKVTVIYATPTQISLLASASTSRRAGPLGSVRLALVGGSKLDSATMKAARTAMPNAAVHEFYGSAETSFIALSDEETPPDSVGRAYPGVELKIGPPALDDGFGQVWVRSPYLSQGPADQFRSADRVADGFMSAGEIGRIDADGYLYLAGRTDRVVTIGGRNASPEVVENYLCKLRGVVNAAVLPQADPLRGNRFIAFVKLSSPEVDVGELGRQCRTGLGSLVSPVEILRREDWPLRPSGKTDLEALAAELDCERN